MLMVERKAVFQFFAQWEQDHRDGKCASYEEARKQTVEEIAEETTEAFWQALSRQSKQIP